MDRVVTVCLLENDRYGRPDIYTFKAWWKPGYR
jgi:hypothetical protein